MTDEQIKDIAEAINPDWWNDDIDLLNFTRVVLSRARAQDEALLRQAQEALDDMVYADEHGDACVKAVKSIGAIKERLK